MKHKIKVYCQQEIPCDPCAASCSKKAIIKKSLTSLPEFKEENCIGCLMCVANCPGQALFYLNEEIGELIFPFEFSVRPKLEEKINLVDEYGNILGLGEVKDYIDKKAFNKTTLIVVKGQLKDLDRTRGIVRRQTNG
ncbi:MAG: Thioredoxin reductase [Fusobacteria bacterium]|nr:MAG: Thioredoxin reductase [Fusobacteriota bacterium]KAF0228492.1 MAG: Thioredoxin [Fusobacteriota bacterium]